MLRLEPTGGTGRRAGSPRRHRRPHPPGRPGRRRRRRCRRRRLHRVVERRIGGLEVGVPVAAKKESRVRLTIAMTAGCPASNTRPRSTSRRRLRTGVTSPDRAGHRTDGVAQGDEPVGEPAVVEQIEARARRPSGRYRVPPPTIAGRHDDADLVDQPGAQRVRGQPRTADQDVAVGFGDEGAHGLAVERALQPGPRRTDVGQRRGVDDLVGAPPSSPKSRVTADSSGTCRASARRSSPRRAGGRRDASRSGASGR